MFKIDTTPTSIIEIKTDDNTYWMVLAIIIALLGLSSITTIAIIKMHKNEPVTNVAECVYE